MPQARDTYRLAIGVFQEPHALRSVLAELAAVGASAEATCLAGKRQVLEAALAEEIAQGTFRLQSVRLPDRNAQLVATAGPTLEMLLQQSMPTDTGVAASGSFWPDLCRNLGKHIGQGQIVLCVSASDATLQAWSSRILLRHSTQSVQTFEFTGARAPAGREPAREAE
jgi:hypothetical protein